VDIAPVSRQVVDASACPIASAGQS
jgi:hypothetical protein